MIMKYEIISAVRTESVTREHVGTRKCHHNRELAAEKRKNNRNHDVLPWPAATSTSDEDVDEVDNRLLPLSCPSTTSPVSPPSILASSYSSASAIGS
jgi:hypothetical protein